MPSPLRFAWLDLFRGACVVGMVETHVLNTFLAAPLRETGWFIVLTHFNGLIAPGFLFIAGYVHGLGLRAPTDRPRAFGRKLRRLGSVWLLGYALHFPAPQIFAGQWSEALRLGTVVDVLQCLTVSLALLLAIERWMPCWADAGALAMLLVAVFAADQAVCWQFSPGGLQAYFNHGTGSLFPLLPWTGFVCAGWLASVWMREPDLAPTLMERAGRSFPHLLTRAAFALTLLLAFVLPGEPGFFFYRLAWLLLLVPVARWIAARWQPLLLLFAGRESLVMYAAHLLLIEALAVTFLARESLSVVACLGIFAGVLPATFAITALWSRRRTTAP